MKEQISQHPLKIGIMSLAHDTYWKFFPQHEQPTKDLAGKFSEYLSQFGSICETGRLIDCAERAIEARRLF